ncbi:hypothetical protein [Symbiobacterium terraclitae]|uniref:hypothetical protein n=1 Tax=Symbiobacterium terraclitae TaxID=557451 RepID=UPI0035B54867
MTPSGFIGKPPPVNGTWVETQAEAWAIYRASPGEYGYPVQVGDRWLVPRPVRVLHAELAAEADRVNQAYGPMFVQTPGGSQKRAQLKPEDRKRIAEQVARRKWGEARPAQQTTVRQAALF